MRLSWTAKFFAMSLSTGLLASACGGCGEETVVTCATDSDCSDGICIDGTCQTGRIIDAGLGMADGSIDASNADANQSDANSGTDATQADSAVTPDAARPDTGNPDSASPDQGGQGQDSDNDGLTDDVDNCPSIANPDQQNSDNDDDGDVCDNCPFLDNSDQADSDFDEVGDVCDNCPSDTNADQADGDIDGIGDACDDDNDVFSSGGETHSCLQNPALGSLNPEPELSWIPDSADPEADSDQVMMTPSVIDLDGDESPEILFISFSTYLDNDLDAANPTKHHPYKGRLRAVHSNDYSEAFATPTNASGSAIDLAPVSNLAVGDIIGDARPEIIAIRSVANQVGLIAFNYDGTVLWDCFDDTSSASACDDASGQWNIWGGPAIADLDEDGTPEIIYGNQVFNNLGQRLWRAPDSNMGRGDAVSVWNDNSVHPIGALSHVADLDGDGKMEIIAGNTVYEMGTDLTDWSVRTGFAHYQGGADSEIADGLGAVADFNLDGDPELVLVAQEVVYLLDGTTGATLSQIHIPRGDDNLFSAGGSPTVANFIDDDSNPEIGVAGRELYVIFDVDPADFSLSVAASFATQEFSSSRTGSSVFDFDGDGSAEVVYNDECYLRILHIDATESDPASRVQEVFKTENSSFTAYEYPVIADVDADGNAEIVVCANDFGRTLMPEDTVENASIRKYYCEATNPGYQVRHGIYVYGDVNDTWVPTRAIWNQHSYHISNVSDSGAIPQHEVRSWTTHNTYRLNRQDQSGGIQAPDLAGGETSSLDRCPVEKLLGVWAQNQGELFVPAGLSVAFYNGEPSPANTAFAVGQTSSALQPGQAEFVSVSWLPPAGGAHVVVIVDDDGTGTGTGAHTECGSGDVSNRVEFDLTACP